MKIYRLSQAAQPVQQAAPSQFPMTPRQMANPQTMLHAKPGNQTIIQAQQAALKQILNMLSVARELHVIEEALDSVKEDYGIDIPFDIDKMMLAVTDGNASGVRAQLEAAKKILTTKAIPSIPDHIDQAISILSNVNRAMIDRSMNVEGLGITKNYVEELMGNIAKSNIGEEGDVMVDFNTMMTRLSPLNPIKTRFFTNL